MTGDQRVSLAREFLAGARRRPLEQLPLMLLLRECAELRRQLGQILDVIGEQVTLSPAQLATVLKALATAADLTEDRADVYCDDCSIHPAGVCDKHAQMLDDVSEFRQLEHDLTGQAGEVTS